MNLFKKYETDVAKERDGVELQFEDCTFRLRRAGGHNRSYRYALALAAQARRDDLQGEAGVDTFNVQEEILQTAFANSVIVGWDNVAGRDGEPMECNAGNFLELVRACPAVWDAIKMAALEDSRFKPAEQEDGETLGKSLSGSLNGVPESETCSDLPHVANG